MAAETSCSSVPEPIGAVIPIGRAPSVRGLAATADQLRHDNPHWPVRSPDDAAHALSIHGDCPWHCSTKVAAICVSAEDYRYFHDRTGGEPWTSRSEF